MINWVAEPRSFDDIFSRDADFTMGPFFGSRNSRSTIEPTESITMVNRETDV